MKIETNAQGIRLGAWNHRVVRKEYPLAAPDERYILGIHEAHYRGPADDTVDDPFEGLAVLEARRAEGVRLPLDRKPHAITTEPVTVQGETIAELRETLERMLRALDTPILDFETRDELPET